jgi:hypothetical protein
MQRFRRLSRALRLPRCWLHGEPVVGEGRDTTGSFRRSFRGFTRVYLGRIFSVVVGLGVFANVESVNHLGKARHKWRSPVS